MAVIQALQMWSNVSYRHFLHGDRGSITDDWFRWFVGEWNVARTIQNGRREMVRRYMNDDFRRAVSNGNGAESVDAAALHIKTSNWSAKLGKTKQPSLPISLVSKIGFFLRPSDLVPLDRYSLLGLNMLRASADTPPLNKPSYQQYLGAFNQQYDTMKPQIAAVLKESWVAPLAGKLGCPDRALTTAALPRKVLDNYLMHSGGYLTGQSRDATVSASS